MNALPPRPIEPSAEARTARHLRQLEELAELGIAMARAVAEAALTPEPAQEPDAPPSTAPAPFRGDLGLVFARISYAVRQTIALEARIAADRDAGPQRPRPGPPDPRRALLRGVLRDAAGPAADRATGSGFRREIDERIEDELAADPGGGLPIDEILAAICDDLGLTLDLSRVPDAVLGAVFPEPDPEAIAAPADHPARQSPSLARRQREAPPGPDPP